jgi:hypothetical protein
MIRLLRLVTLASVSFLFIKHRMKQEERFSQRRRQGNHVLDAVILQVIELAFRQADS